MSYILDALRRADAEREQKRGAVPGLHAQPLDAVLEPSQPSRAALPGWLWPLAGLLIVLVGGLVWRWSAAPDLPPQPAPVTSTAATAPTDSAPIVGSQTGPDVAPPIPIAQPILPVEPAGPAQRWPPATTARVAPATSAGLPSDVASSPSTPTTAPATTLAAQPAEASASVAADRRVYTLAELPDAVRRALPPLAIGGASYSEHPANRLVIINGNVFHEGDTLAPDLTLDEIKLKSAVLRYRTYRYSITY